jgi:Ser/Thr protein kinase RdoA (MazF antagonist)
VVEGDLVVIDSSRRNRNFQVVSETGRSYLLKQGIGPGGAMTIVREAAALRFLQSDPHARGVGRYLPPLQGYDARRGVLTLGLLRQAESLREHQTRRGRFPVRLATQLGDALGRLHQVPIPGNAEMARGPAWILSLHRPWVSVFRDVSAANLQLIMRLQGDAGFCRLLDELREGWIEDALIHGDIKADNLVVFAHDGARRRTRLAVVDWEGAGRGDACWDVGSVFSDYLATWLSSMPITGESPPDHFMELARYPLDDLQPAIRAFWRAYTRRRGFAGAVATQHLMRSVRYGAARLVQNCYEQMQMATHFTGIDLCLLQLSLNILQRPLEASVHLLGIELTETA